MTKTCNKCSEEKSLEEFYKGRNDCKVCNNAIRKANYDKTKDGNHYVYYLPEPHYCGVTDNLEKRISIHKARGKNVEGWRVLYSSPNKSEAYHHEAMFQGVLGMNGLNYK